MIRKAFIYLFEQVEEADFVDLSQTRWVAENQEFWEES